MEMKQILTLKSGHTSLGIRRKLGESGVIGKSKERE